MAAMEVQLPLLTAGPAVHIQADQDEMFQALGVVVAVQIQITT